MSITTSSAFINFTNGTPRADKIIATSNIGIGTNAPAYELDVVGNANVYSINTNSLYLEDFIISSSHGLDHVTNENNSTGDTIISTNATTGFQASSNIVVGGDINLTGNIYQNGTIFTGGSGGIDTTQTLALSNVTTGLTVSSNAVVTGNVTADSFIGDGSQLTGVGIDTTQTLTLSNVTTGLQASSNIVVGGDINLTGNIYQNGTIFTGGGSSLWSESGSDIYYNSGNVGISNAAPAHTLSIGSNLYVDDVGSNVLVVGGNVSVSNVITAQRLKLNNVSVITNQDFQQITNVGNVTTNTVEFTNPTTSLVASGNVEVGGELSVSGNVEVGGELSVSGDVEIGTANLFVDTTTGNVGVGTASPKSTLDVYQGPNITFGGTTATLADSPSLTLSSSGGKWGIFLNSNSDLMFVGKAGTTGSYTGASGYVLKGNRDVLMNFTGQHRTFIKDIPFSQAGDLEGLIVSADQSKYIKMSGGIETGSNAITTNESLPVVSLSVTVNDKKCFGVISASEDPETREELHGNFGSVFEKELGDTRVYINSVGEGAMWVVNTNGSLESGDYITTSNVPGYGQKQDSDSLKNYTVAKITMDCDFNPSNTSVQRILRSNVVETYYTAIVNGVEEEVDSDHPHAVEHIRVTNKLENVLDKHGQLQWEDDPSGVTEKAYKIRYLDASGQQTDEANAVHIAAFVGCTYHCG